MKHERIFSGLKSAFLMRVWNAKDLFFYITKKSEEIRYTKFASLLQPVAKLMIIFHKPQTTLLGIISHTLFHGLSQTLPFHPSILTWDITSIFTVLLNIQIRFAEGEPMTTMRRSVRTTFKIRTMIIRKIKQQVML